MAHVSKVFPLAENLPEDTLAALRRGLEQYKKDDR